MVYWNWTLVSSSQQHPCGIPYCCEKSSSRPPVQFRTIRFPSYYSLDLRVWVRIGVGHRIRAWHSLSNGGYSGRLQLRSKFLHNAVPVGCKPTPLFVGNPRTYNNKSWRRDYSTSKGEDGGVIFLTRRQVIGCDYWSKMTTNLFGRMCEYRKSCGETCNRKCQKHWSWCMHPNVNPQRKPQPMCTTVLCWISTQRNNHFVYNALCGPFPGYS